MFEDSRELLIGVVAVVALAADVDQFTVRQMLLGILLSLFLVGDFLRLGVVYNQVVYAAVAGCCGLLVLGWPVQEIFASYGMAHWSEVGFGVTWVLVSLIVYWIRKVTATEVENR